MGFDAIVGNGRARSLLRLALRRGRVPSSLLFGGPRGVGKRAAARVLAQALNCGRLPDDACGECESCRLIAGRNHPDVQEIDIRDEKTRVAIDQVKEMKSLAYLRPMMGRRRVFIVDEAEEMSEPAAHSILKLLEEPPLFTHIILVSDQPVLLLPTIRSRCQGLSFLPVSDEDIERALRDRGVEGERARLLALVVHGDLERALEADGKKVESDRDQAWLLFRALTREGDPSALLRRFAFGRRKEVAEELTRTLELLLAFGRDACLLAEKGDPRFLLNPDRANEIRECAAVLGPEGALRVVGALHRAAVSLDRMANTGLLAAVLSARWRSAAAAS